MGKVEKVMTAAIAAVVLAIATAFALWLVWLRSGETPAFAVDRIDLENPVLLARAEPLVTVTLRRTGNDVTPHHVVVS